jgi:putative effector of murein hydrolase LrgA (UPF0299 family)
MLKAAIGLGALVFLFVLAIIYVPSVAEIIPQSDFVREAAAPLAVLVSLAALMVWRPKGQGQAD